MAGFGKITFYGEYFNQAIVNIFWFRSTEWLPLQGNPFDDSLAFIDAFLTHVQTAWLTNLPTDYQLREVQGTGYADDFKIVTASPVVRTVGANGSITNDTTTGAPTVAVIALRCGTQVQINGIGQSKRNRGYIAYGPIGDGYVDNYAHLSPGMQGALESLAALLDDNITVLNPAVTLHPIRIHEKTVQAGPLKVLQYRTYSDITGYAVRRLASYRRSRQPEA